MKYISHYSAACIWDVPFLDWALGAYGIERGANRETLDVTFSDCNERNTKPNRIVHYCGLDLPRRAIVWQNGVRVSSPQLLFLQLANKLDIHRVILLGLLLVSHQPGRPCEAITTKQKLKAFVEAAPMCKGSVKAKQALRYIENGSASLLEAIAFMMLTLPTFLGGYALAGATFNHEVILMPEAQKRFRQKRCFVDMYYCTSKLAVEYDSFAHHNSPAEQAKDMLRASALERQGITTMRFGTVQLYDKKACEEFAHNLAKRLNQRIRIRSKNFESAQQALRELLPSQSETTRP